MNSITEEKIQGNTASLIDLESIRKKRINIVIFGHGRVGGQLIDQIQKAKRGIASKKDIQLNIFCIANSRKLILTDSSFNADWRWAINRQGKSYNIEEVIEFARSKQLGNLIAVDNTASEDFVSHYPTLVKNGFHLVSSNKIGNTLSQENYSGLRKLLAENRKEYLYETNVGAGLPLLDTIRLLHLSGETITRIRGVFSGTLSYIFNEFSNRDVSFSKVLRSAIQQGFTEPDPREDLNGSDVGRKLLILARELEFKCEMSDVKIQNLIPKEQRNISRSEFLENLPSLDVPFHYKRKNQKPEHVLRYVGDLRVDDLNREDVELEVKLVSVPKNSVLGQLKGKDSLFEIFTENYQKYPIVIQGAGAGANVTARGVLGDILRIGEKLN